MLTDIYPKIIIIPLALLFFIIQLLKKKITPLHFLYLMLFAVYIANVVSFTIFPYPFQKLFIDTMIEDNMGMEHNLIPFNSIIDSIKNDYSIEMVIQLSKNIILFLPFGFIVPILFSKISIQKMVFLGFLLSLIIALIQLLLDQIVGYNYRSFDVDNIIMNTFGSFLGVLLFKFSYKTLKKNGLLLLKEK